MKNLLLLAILTTIVSGCASSIPEKETRFTTTVQISQYNTLINEYVNQATFGSIQKFSNHNAYYLKADRYGSGYLQIYVTNENLDNYKAALEKYLIWNKQALENGDLIDKTILSYKEGLSLWKFNFHSGSESAHYFNILACSGGLMEVCTTMASLDEENTIKLIKELELFNSDKLVSEDIESKYK